MIDWQSPDECRAGLRVSPSEPPPARRSAPRRIAAGRPSRRPGTDADAETVIIGAGTGGCALAAHLVQAGQRVLLLEAGPDYGRRGEGGWPTDLLLPNIIPTSHQWQYRSRSVEGREIDHARARVVGGCSAHNHCGIVWGSSSVYDKWSQAAGDRWSAERMAGHLDQAATAFRSVPVLPDQLRPLGRTFLDVARASLDIPVIAASGFCARAAGPFHFNISDGHRFNAAFAYLDPLRPLDELRVRGDVEVDRLEVVDNRVVRVWFRDGAEYLEPETVVLAAGAYGTPELLMRSGVGDPDRLQRVGVEPVHPLPEVGRSLRDHPAVALVFEASPELKRLNREQVSPDWMPRWQTFVKERSSVGDVPFDLHLYPTEQVGPDGETLVVIGIACMSARSLGEVSLARLDHETRVQLDHRYLSDPDDHDMQVLLDGIELARLLFAASPLRHLVRRELEPGLDCRGAELTAWVRRSVMHYFHPAGTCRMGREPEDSVVDDRGAVQGLENLFAADASIMPVLPDANTNLPVAALATNIAEAIVGRPVFAPTG